MTRTLRFGLQYDFRNPLQWRQPWVNLYQGLIEQIEWADRDLGFDNVWLSEHHFVEDGYTPSVLALAAALALRTRRVTLGTAVLLLPLHHPLRVAEDALTVSVLANGRFALGVGAGYRPGEFDGLGESLKHRGVKMEESLKVLRCAFRGEEVSFQGRRVNIPPLRVTPPPVQPGGPDIWVGGVAGAAIERAARLADGFIASGPDQLSDYVTARRKLGLPQSEDRACLTHWAITSADPEREWAEVGKHAVYQFNEYIDYGFFGDPAEVARYPDPDAVLKDGLYALYDAEAAAGAIVELATKYPVEEVHYWAVLPGESIDNASRRIDYLASKVIPLVKERLAAID